MEDVEPTVSRDEIRQILFANNDHVRNEFVEHFGPGINNFVILMDNAYRAIAGRETQVPNEFRSDWTYNFLFIAFNNLLTSFHLHDIRNDNSVRKPHAAIRGMCRARATVLAIRLA